MQEKANWFDVGIQTLMSPRFIRNLEVTTYDNPEIAGGTITKTVRAGFVRYLTGVHPIRTVEYPDGLWQSIKQFIPFLTPRMISEPVELHVYNVCPHVEKPDDADLHWGWLSTANTPESVIGDG